MDEALPYALGVAISPVPIAATLLLLTCPQAVANASSFLAGWVVGIALAAMLFVLLVSEAGLTDSDPAWIAVAELVLGVAFLASACVLWLRRHRRGMRDAAWIPRIDDLTTARSAGLGAVLAGANPKVAVLALGAALALAQADADSRTTTQAVVLFTAVGAMGILAPLAIYLAAPRRAQSVLGRMRARLARHDTYVLVVVGLLVGVLFLSDAAKGL